MIRLAKPVMGGLVSTLVASRAVATADDRDRDIPPSWIYALTAVCLLIAAWLAYTFAKSIDYGIGTFAGHRSDPLLTIAAAVAIALVFQPLRQRARLLPRRLYLSKEWPRSLPG